MSQNSYFVVFLKFRKIDPINSITLPKNLVKFSVISSLKMKARKNTQIFPNISHSPQIAIFTLFETMFILLSRKEERNVNFNSKK